MTGKTRVRILFVESRYSDSIRFSGEDSLSLYVLAAFLKANVHDVDLDIRFAFSDTFTKFIGDRFDICGIYSPTQAWNQACNTAALMKKRGAFVIVGGPHISSLPLSLTEDFHAGCIGPGEKVLERLVHLVADNGTIALRQLQEIRGIVVHSPKGLQITEPSSQSFNLDESPSPYDYYLKPNRKRCRIISSVGCPHSCYFCAAKVMNPCLRLRSAGKLVEEMSFLHYKYKIKNFKFVDDNFLINSHRLRSLISLLRDRGMLQRITISCTSSSKFITEENVESLKLLNTESVNLGFESGSERILRRLKSGQISLADHERAIRLLNRNRIMVYGTFIVGTPGETTEDMQETLSFVARNQIHHLSCYLLKPLPGTPFWNELVKEGKIDPYNVDFRELSLSTANQKWYFNDSSSIEDTLKYVGKINRIGTLRTIRYHYRRAFFYGFLYNQAIAVMRSIFIRDKPEN
jgi:anaerobic magnesium-protoporphyrin IX monomethyl ester cyclase